MIAYNTTFIMRPSEEDTFLAFSLTKQMPIVLAWHSLLML